MENEEIVEGIDLTKYDPRARAEIASMIRALKKDPIAVDRKINASIAACADKILKVENEELTTR